MTETTERLLDRYVSYMYDIYVHPEYQMMIKLVTYILKVKLWKKIDVEKG